ncbi:hypothetical protein NKG05_07710 [Oerskovia sp. M15]
MLRVALRGSGPTWSASSCRRSPSCSASRSWWGRSPSEPCCPRRSRRSSPRRSSPTCTCAAPRRSTTPRARAARSARRTVPSRSRSRTRSRGRRRRARRARRVRPDRPGRGGRHGRHDVGSPSIGIAVGPDEPTVTLASGAWPVEATEIALEESAASAGGLTTGDATTVVLAGAPQPVTVTGIFAIEAAAAAPSWWGSTRVRARDLRTRRDGPHHLGLRRGRSVGAGGRRPGGRGPARGAESLTGEAMREEARQGVEQILGFIETFLLVFAAIALFVGRSSSPTRSRCRCASDSVSSPCCARSARPRQVFASILAQAVAVGLLGAATGVVLGRVLVSGLRAVFGSTGMELSGRVPLSATSVVVAIGLGVLVSVVAAAVPGRHAALTLRSRPCTTTSHQTAGPAPGRWPGWPSRWSGRACWCWPRGSGARRRPTRPGGHWSTTSTPGPARGRRERRARGRPGPVPAIAGAVITVLAVPAVAAIRPLGRLARGNVTRSPRRTSNTAGALLIGMALVSATGVIAASTQASVRSIVDEQVRADYVIQAAAATGALPAGVTDAVTGLPAVGQALTLRLGTLDVDGEASGPTVVPPGFFTEALDAPVVEGDPDQALVDGEAVVRRTAARDNGWEVGDTLTLTSDDGSRSEDVRVGAIIDTQVVPSDVVLADATYANVGAADIPTYAVYVSAAPGPRPPSCATPSPKPSNRSSWSRCWTARTSQTQPRPRWTRCS